VISYTTDLINRFRGKGILVDTTLLLLFFVGTYNPSILERGAFDQLAAYSLEDFKILCNLTSLFAAHVTVLYVLAEVSNWIWYLLRSHEIECLSGFATAVHSYKEWTADSFELAGNAVFPYLGLTYTALASLAEDFLVAADDARMIAHLNRMGKEGLNINHLRQELWASQLTASPPYRRRFAHPKPRRTKARIQGFFTSLRMTKLDGGTAILHSL
jgi:hypothetical protein